MRFIFLIFTLLFSVGVEAQLNVSDAQYSSENFLVNPSFEQGKKGWTLVNGSWLNTQVASNVAHFKSSAAITVTGQILDFSQTITVPSGSASLPGLASISVKNTVADLFFCAEVNNVTEGCVALKTDGAYHTYVLDVQVLGATNTILKLVSFAVATGTIYADDAKLVVDKSALSGSNSLLKNPDFEGTLEEFACTNATAEIVPSTIPTVDSVRMFQMTVTGVGGYCDFIATTGAKFEGLPFKIGGLFQTELVDVEYCTLVNGTEDNCIPVSAIADDATDPFNQPFSTQSLSGATSAGVRIKTTVATSGVINLDKLKLELGGLPTSPTVNCESELDCANEFSAAIDLGGAISNESISGWLSTCSYTGGGIFDCDVNPTLVTSPLNCTCIVNPSATSGDSSCSMDALATATTISYNVSSNGVAAQRGVSMFCQKAAPDYKSLTQQGAVNVAEVSRKCTSDLDCENVYSAFVTSAGVVSRETGGDWINGNGVAASPSITLTLTSGLVTSGMNCLAVGAQRSEVLVATSNTTTIVVNQFNSSGSALLGDFYIECTKTEADYNLIKDRINHTVAASVATNFVSGGAEVLTADTWDTKPIYRRCYEVTSNITTNTTIATIASGLEPVNAYGYFADNFLIAGSEPGSSFSQIRYIPSSGAITATVSGASFIVLAGTRFCFKYTKP